MSSETRSDVTGVLRAADGVEPGADHAPLPPAGIGRVVTAMVTPFTADRELDLDAAQVIADHLVRHGSDTVLVNGTTGESPTLEADEPWQLLRVVQQAVGDRVPIVIGTGSNSTARTIEHTVRAEQAGADAALVVTPYYNRPDQRGLLGHFRAVAESVELPIVLYDIPGRTGREIDVATFAELAHIPNIVGVKDAANNLGKSGDVATATAGAAGGFVQWSGADEVNLPMLSLGAVGVISVAAHLAGPELAAMVTAADTDPIRARALHLACMPLHRALFAEPSPAPLKGALNALGLPAGPVRPPLSEASEEAVKAVLAALEPLEASR
jgi:4-hydroxy-tetrahydrodipicolinate synthase